MKRILALAALLCCIAAGAQDFEGTFKQVKTMKASGKVVKSEGTVSFTAPDQLAMLYTVPDGDYFIIDGPFIRMDMRGVAADVDSNSSKLVRSQRNAILYSITGQYEDIAKEMDADCTVTEKAGAKHVSIKARQVTPKGYSGMELDYNKKGALTKMVLEEFGGISTEYQLFY